MFTCESGIQQHTVLNFTEVGFTSTDLLIFIVYKNVC